MCKGWRGRSLTRRTMGKAEKLPQTSETFTCLLDPFFPTQECSKPDPNLPAWVWYAVWLFATNPKPSYVEHWYTGWHLLSLSRAREVGAPLDHSVWEGRSRGLTKLWVRKPPCTGRCMNLRWGKVRAEQARCKACEQLSVWLYTSLVSRDLTSMPLFSLAVLVMLRCQ